MRLTNWSGFTKCTELAKNNYEVMPMNNNKSSQTLYDSFNNLVNACSELKTTISTKSIEFINSFVDSESMVSYLALLQSNL